MKIINRFTSFFITVVLIFLYCSDPSSFNENERFAIYLFENDTLSTIDVEEENLSKVRLKDKPSINFNDIVGYEIENHKIYLEERFSYYFGGGDSLVIFSHYFGKPFVLVANGERIYLGSLTPGESSWSSNTPKILSFSINNIEKSFIISGAPIYDESTYVDVRNDKRIIQALKDKIIQ